MKYEKLAEIDGNTLSGWRDWLAKEGDGCCHKEFAAGDGGLTAYSVCMGWTQAFADESGKWKIAWKIGCQAYNQIMQCDLDLDFEEPWDEETGDVDSTLSPVSEDEDWDALAGEIRAAAERVADRYAEPPDEYLV